MELFIVENIKSQSVGEKKYNHNLVSNGCVIKENINSHPRNIELEQKFKTTSITFNLVFVFQNTIHTRVAAIISLNYR